MKHVEPSNSDHKKGNPFHSPDEHLLATGRSQVCGSLSELFRYVCPIGVHAIVVLVVLLMLHLVEMVRHPLQMTAPHEAAWGIMEQIDIYTATTVVCLFCGYLLMQLGMLLVSGVKQTWRELFSDAEIPMGVGRQGKNAKKSQMHPRVRQAAHRSPQTTDDSAEGLKVARVGGAGEHLL